MQDAGATRFSRLLRFFSGGDNKDGVAGGNLSRIPVIGRPRPVAGRESAKFCKAAILHEIVKHQAQALKIMEDMAARKLPADMGFEWTAMSFQEKLVGNQAIFVFAIASLLE